MLGPIPSRIRPTVAIDVMRSGRNDMRALTVCLPYYENPGMWQRQCESFRTLPEKWKEFIHLIVVDDGSPKHPAVKPDPPLGIEFQLYRMKVDIPWNQDACRNLAAHHASTEWLLLTDIDHLVPHKTMGKVISVELDPEIAYQFNRVSEPEMKEYKPHPNSWLMTKALYWKAGGYDERFAASFGETWGIYGTDGLFRKQVRGVAKIKPFKMPLVRVPREVTSDASTTTYDRRTHDMDAKRTMVKELIKNSGSREPATLTFPWERIV